MMYVFGSSRDLPLSPPPPPPPTVGPQVGGNTQKLGSFGEVAKWGPRAKAGQSEFEHPPRKGGLPLETPEYEFSRTPRTLSREGDPYFQVCESKCERGVLSIRTCVYVSRM
jgi:hypothetical protein